MGGGVCFIKLAGLTSSNVQEIVHFHESQNFNTVSPETQLLSIELRQSSTRFNMLFNIIHAKQAGVAVTLQNCIRKSV
jgi:hypothetical protein